MSDFQIGQIFENEYPPLCTSFLSKNNCEIKIFETVERTVERIDHRPGVRTGLFVVFTDGSDLSTVPGYLKKYAVGTKHQMRRFIIAKKPEMTPEELKAKQAAQVRAQRDAMIAETDYLMMSDYPISEEDKALVETYRQALRDIPEQEGFPSNVQWPVAPLCLK